MDEEEQLELRILDGEEREEEEVDEEEEEYVWDLTGMKREELEVSSSPFLKEEGKGRRQPSSSPLPLLPFPVSSYGFQEEAFRFLSQAHSSLRESMIARMVDPFIDYAENLTSVRRFNPTPRSLSLPKPHACANPLTIPRPFFLSFFLSPQTPP